MKLFPVSFAVIGEPQLSLQVVAGSVAARAAAELQDQLIANGWTSRSAGAMVGLLLVRTSAGETGMLVATNRTSPLQGGLPLPGEPANRVALSSEYQPVRDDLEASLSALQATPAVTTTHDPLPMSLHSSGANPRWLRKQRQLREKRLRDLAASRPDPETEKRRILRALESLDHAQWRAWAERQYVSNFSGQVVTMDSLYGAHVPVGAGDCPAPRLFGAAVLQNMTPLAFAQFWWGAQPAAEIRHHAQFYVPCKAKCGPLLTFQMQGLDVASPMAGVEVPCLAPRVLFEDAHLLILEKPAGLRSVAGHDGDSVAQWLARCFPDRSPPLLVHRLDQPTSGLLVAAKGLETHRNLQQQFVGRGVKKRYDALLQGELAAPEGEINLPLRVDLDDRPRQMVCDRWGRSALTHWRRLGVAEGMSRVAFFPHTGRTHQLRMHAAHRDGLAMPIVGDTLYGWPAQRLMLHAAELDFLHPADARPLHFESQVPF